MKFRIWTILWVFALFASAMATFGFFSALFLSIPIAFTWNVLLSRSRRNPINIVDLLVLLMLWMIVYSALNPAISRSYEPERVAACHAKFTQLVNTVLDYREQHKSLPLGGKQSAVSGAAQSWRSVIFQHVSTSEGALAYDQFKAWDEPANLSFARQSPPPDLCCRNDSLYAGEGKVLSTSYFAVIGDKTAWNALASPTNQFEDDPRTTILLLEQLERGIPWTQPKDLNFNEALNLLITAPNAKKKWLPCHWAAENRFFMKESPIPRAQGVHAAFADGSVRFIPLPLSIKFATALLTANGGEKISEKEFAKLWKHELNYARIYSFTIFMLVALLPIFKLLRRVTT